MTQYWKYEIPKTSDVLDVCKSIFETGLVDVCKPVTTEVYKVTYCGPSASKVIEVTHDAKELDTQYYNLSGQRVNAPSGLTIVVTRYSDGSVKTEKRLFP